MLWVIPCRYDPIVWDCVASIRRHFPDDEILLVDSNSPDRSYLDLIDVDHVETGNDRRHVGTWKRALGYDADRFALIHDSLIVHAHWEPGDFQVVRWFHESGPPTDQRSFIDAELDSIGHELPDSYAGIFGPMLFCTRDVLEDFAATGLLDAQPADVIEAAAMERLTGIVAADLGYDVCADSLQGQMGDFFGRYTHAHVEKIHMARP